MTIAAPKPIAEGNWGPRTVVDNTIHYRFATSTCFTEADIPAVVLPRAAYEAFVAGVEARVMEAVEAEREACAVFVEQHVGAHHSGSAPHHRAIPAEPDAARLALAAAIRSRSAK